METLGKYLDSLQVRHEVSPASTTTDQEQLAEGKQMRMTWNSYACWYWQGKMGRPVPLSFEFPLTTTKGICDLFMFGIQRENIRPFRFITSPSELKRKHHQYFSKARLVFEEIIGSIVNKKLVQTRASIFSLTMADWDAAFDVAFMSLIDEITWVLQVCISRPTEMSFSRFYDLVNDKNKCMAEYFADDEVVIT
jgi:hypothetical protein